MSVYVDNMRARVGRMIMCHMIADSTSELIYMAEHIGVAKRWIHDSGTPREHFDICLSARAEAVDRGAIQITQQALAMKIYERGKVNDGNRRVGL